MYRVELPGHSDEPLPESGDGGAERQVPDRVLSGTSYVGGEGRIVCRVPAMAQPELEGFWIGDVVLIDAEDRRVEGPAQFRPAAEAPDVIHRSVVAQLYREDRGRALRLEVVVHAPGADAGPDKGYDDENEYQ